jgi:hypothetical protein
VEIVTIFAYCGHSMSNVYIIAAFTELKTALLAVSRGTVMGV